MPLHLNSVTNDSDNSNVLAWIFSQVNDSELGFASKNSNYIHLFKPLVDSISKKQIGRIVYTLKNNDAEKRLEVLDVDIVFENSQSVDLSFLSLRKGSSDSNEYYDVELKNGKSGHMSIETVNRHMIEEEICGTTRKVHLCAFPFKLSLYNSMEALNKALGFTKPVKVGDTDFEVSGFSDEFVAPGDLFGAEDGETFSFILGRIESYREVLLQMGKINLPFILADVTTGAGTIPIPMGKEVFNLQELHEGSYVAMHADVKADFADAYQKNIVTGADGTENKEISDEKGANKGLFGKIKRKFRKQD